MLSDRLVLALSLVVVDLVERIDDILRWGGSSRDLPESTTSAHGQLAEQAGAGTSGTLTPAATTKPRPG
jgi:hypothetical protein